MIKIKDLFRYKDRDTIPVRFEPKDSRLIKNLKKKFSHNDRTLIYRDRQFVTDSLYCHAAPGTVEIILTELKSKLKRGGQSNKLLNLGGGTGQVSDLFRSIGYDVFNLDIEVKKNDSKNMYFDLNWGKPLPYSKNFFDVIVCQEVIEHIENPWQLIRQVSRVLKPGGILVLTTPNIQSTYSKKIFNETGYFTWFTPDNFSYHINPIPVWEVEMITKKNNLEIKKIRGSGDYYFALGEGDTEGVVRNNECLIFTIRK